MSMMVDSHRFGIPGAASPGEYLFGGSGATQELIVPIGVTSIEFALWGAGASGGTYNTGSEGGGGGYVSGFFPVTPGDVLRVQVGRGGGAAPSSASGGAGGWPDGGGGSRGDTYCGGGGGSSRIWKNGTLMVVAGGGGGGGGYGGGGVAGGGGGLTGQSASGSGGTGGSQVAGGVDSNDSGNATKTGQALASETNRTGGWGNNTGTLTTSTSDDGGGGGGGFYGGGGGGGDGQSGGGGSSYLHTDVVYSENLQAVRRTPYSGHSKYPGSNAAFGTQSSGSFNVNPGNDGYAYIFLDDVLPESTITVLGSKTFSWTSASSQVVSLTDLKDAANSDVVLQDGDLVVLALVDPFLGNNSAASMTPSGWTNRVDAYGDSGADTNLAVNYKFMPSSPDASVTIPALSDTNYGKVAVLFAFRGVNLSTPFDVSDAVASAGGTILPNPPAVAGTTQGALTLVVAGGCGSSLTTGQVYNRPGYLSATTNDWRSVSLASINDGVIGMGVRKVLNNAPFDPAPWTFTGIDAGTYSWAAASMVLRPV